MTWLESLYINNKLSSRAHDSGDVLRETGIGFASTASTMAWKGWLICFSLLSVPPSICTLLLAGELQRTINKYSGVWFMYFGIRPIVFMNLEPHQVANRGGSFAYKSGSFALTTVVWLVVIAPLLACCVAPRSKSGGPSNTQSNVSNGVLFFLSLVFAAVNVGLAGASYGLLSREDSLYGTDISDMSPCIAAHSPSCRNVTATLGGWSCSLLQRYGSSENASQWAISILDENCDNKPLLGNLAIGNLVGAVIIFLLALHEYHSSWSSARKQEQERRRQPVTAPITAPTAAAAAPSPTTEIPPRSSIESASSYVRLPRAPHCSRFYDPWAEPRTSVDGVTSHHDDVERNTEVRQAPVDDNDPTPLYEDVSPPPYSKEE